MAFYFPLTLNALTRDKANKQQINLLKKKKNWNIIIGASLVSKIILLKKKIKLILFSNGLLNWSKVTVYNLLIFVFIKSSWKRYVWVYTKILYRNVYSVCIDVFLQSCLVMLAEISHCTFKEIIQACTHLFQHILRSE